jgi:hypothetical protein
VIVIKCVDLTGIAGHPANGFTLAGMYLRSYDPEFADGRGLAEWTADIELAMKFPTTGEAWMLWRRPSRVQPIRADGRPNRPLTAFTIEVLNEEDA